MSITANPSPIVIAGKPFLLVRVPGMGGWRVVPGRKSSLRRVEMPPKAPRVLPP